MRLKNWSVGLCLFAVVLAAVPASHAIPAFSRQYGTSCSTCHVDFPKLNDFGKAFKDAGFKFPKDDETFLKIPPVMLGAPAQREMWPHTIWPGTIPGMPQIGLRFNTFFQVYGNNRNNFLAGTTGPYIPKTDFQPGLFSIFTAGNFGDGIAFWVDDDFSVGGANSAGGLGDGYLKFVNIGRLFKLPTDFLNLRIGQFEIDLPFSQARSWNLSGWDIYDQANFGAMNGANPQNVSNSFAFSAPGQGVEISGGHNYGGYHYSLAVLNQNTSSGATAAGDGVSPEVGIFSDSNFKDLYGRFQYRFNLERDPASRNDIQAAGATGPRDHTYLQLGSYYFYGRSVQRVSPEGGGILTAREPFYRTGGDFSFNYRTFNLFGLYMYGHDKNLLECTPGTPGCTGTGFVSGLPAHFNGGFLEADYLALPWLMTILRYDRVQSTADFINGQYTGSAGSTSYYSPASATRNRVSPGVQFLIHANIKASLEYQFRPQQQVFDGSGNAVSSPFRTNQAIAGLEWVY